MLKSDLLMIHLETNDPLAPWALTDPTVLPNSWFINKVKVPLLLSKAPKPSGIPTILYPPTDSGTVNIEVVVTPVATGRI